MALGITIGLVVLILIATWTEIFAWRWPWARQTHRRVNTAPPTGPASTMSNAAKNDRQPNAPREPTVTEIFLDWCKEHTTQIGVVLYSPGTQPGNIRRALITTGDCYEPEDLPDELRRKLTAAQAAVKYTHANAGDRVLLPMWVEAEVRVSMTVFMTTGTLTEECRCALDFLKSLMSKHEVENLVMEACRNIVGARMGSPTQRHGTELMDGFKVQINTYIYGATVRRPARRHSSYSMEAVTDAPPEVH